MKSFTKKMALRSSRAMFGGQTTLKECGDLASATKLYDKLVREKTGKGYVEVGAPATAPTSVDQRDQRLAGV